MNSSSSNQTTDNSNPPSPISSPVPRLDLAPKLNHTLLLRNPLDYLRLLFWAFFFPQAIRWYLNTFAHPAYKKAKGRELYITLRHDPVQRHLVLMAIIILIVITWSATWVLQQAGLPANWFGVVFGLTVGLAFGLAFGVVFDLAVGLAVGLTVGLASGLASGLAGDVVGGPAGGLAIGLAVGLVVGLPFGMTVGVAVSLTISLAVSLAVVVVFVDAGIVSGLAVFVIAFGLMGTRLLEWLVAWLPARLGRVWGAGGRLVWLPLPALQTELVNQLETDWMNGVYNLNQVLGYTLQFVPVVNAINKAMIVVSPTQLLSHVALLVDNCWDWDLIRFGSASLRATIMAKFINGLFILGPLRRRWQARYSTAPRLDTSARAACAGFWLWYKKETEQAVTAFEKVKELPQGPELHGMAQAIHTGLTAQDLPALVAWLSQVVWLDSVSDPELRPGSLATLRILRTVAEQARLLQQAQTPLTRSLAANKANALLTHILETGVDICPEPEWSLIQKIAEQWRKIFSFEGGTLNEELLRRPITNPYEGYSGLPVTGSAFVGRSGIIRQLETLWASALVAPPLVLFGHRRMGKSSILRNLTQVLPTESHLVYLDMQDSGFVEHTGELLFDLAQALYRQASQSRLNLGLLPAQADYLSLGPARQSLNALLEQLDAVLPAGQRLILAIDEFEVIQDGIDAGRIEADVLKYLRAINQKYAWLNLIFAGLHQLDELGRDYKSIFYGQAEHLKVGYLSYTDAVELIVRPHRDFSLEYEPALVEELYRLTYGQPYLLQRLCWELVNHWNERFLIQGENTPRLLMMSDLEPVLTPDFYHGAGYYFDGVWSNITAGEQMLLQAMAPCSDRRWTTVELITATGLDPAAVAQAVELLDRHDVVVCEDDTIRFASELMRRWIVEIQPGERE